MKDDILTFWRKVNIITNLAMQGYDPHKIAKYIEKNHKAISELPEITKKVKIGNMNITIDICSIETLKPFLNILYESM